MNIIMIGAAGFIGTNLTIKLAEDKNNKITLVDKDLNYFSNVKRFCFDNVKYVESGLDGSDDFSFLSNQDIVYHLMSTNIPTTSNQHISKDIELNALFSARLFDACVKYNVKKVIFMSSGGTVYGKEAKCPLPEETPTNPISSYGVQKVIIEKLLYLYNYMYGLDYRIIRLANPYGPYQRPNGMLGAVTTFTYKALNKELVHIYGDGSVIRDFIYIDDAVRGILNIVNNETKHHIYNLGCGYGTSINDLLDTLEEVLNVDICRRYEEGRAVDVPVNYMDISRYEEEFGTFNPIDLKEGIRRTADFMKRELL